MPGEGFDHVAGLAAQGGGDRIGGAFGFVAAAKAHHQGAAAGALGQGGYRGAVALADDQIALSVARLRPVPGGRRAVAYGPVVAQH